MKSRAIKTMIGISALMVVSTLVCSNVSFAQESLSQSSTTPVPVGPTDAQIAAIVVAANLVDIDAGKVGRNSKNKEVKAFANLMIKDHMAVNKQAVNLVKKLKVTPEESATSKSLKKGGKENLENLNKLKGAKFDKAYVDHEVTYHQQVLDEIDKVLIPNAKNADLRALLEKVRPAIDAHLQHAPKIQAKLY